MEQLIQQLKVILGTNFALYLKSHNYHWNIEGANFLNNFYTQVFAQTDPIAENIRYLDAYVPGSMERFLELSDIKEAVDAIPSPVMMMTELKEDNDRFIFHLRAGIVAADQAGEPAVSNFLQDILSAHQKKAWMLRSIIK